MGIELLGRLPRVPSPCDLTDEEDVRYHAFDHPYLKLALQDKVMSLREQLAEERQLLLGHESEKAVLESRIDRLTHIVLNSTRVILATSPSPPLTQSSVDGQDRVGAASSAATMPLTPDTAPDSMWDSSPDHQKQLASVRREQSTSNLVCSGNFVWHQPGMRSGYTWYQVTILQVRGAGDIHPGTAVSLYEYESPYLAENELLREHLRLLVEEMDARVIHSSQADLTMVDAPSSSAQVCFGSRPLPTSCLVDDHPMSEQCMVKFSEIKPSVACEGTRAPKCSARQASCSNTIAAHLRGELMGKCR